MVLLRAQIYMYIYGFWFSNLSLVGLYVSTRGRRSPLQQIVCRYCDGKDRESYVWSFIPSSMFGPSVLPIPVLPFESFTRAYYLNSKSVIPICKPCSVFLLLSLKFLNCPLYFDHLPRNQINSDDCFKDFMWCHSKYLKFKFYFTH